MLVAANEITTLIPQRAPIVMIGQLLFADEQKTITRFTIDPNCILVENGLLSESGLVENMAQTAAAGVGYVCKKENKPVPIGFIASIKNLQILDLPLAGTEVETEMSIVNEIMGITIVTGKVYNDSTVFAKCEMRIYIQPNN